MKKKKKVSTSILVIIFVLSFVFVIGSTFALLKDSTEKITNTFRYGKVNIELVELAGEDMDYEFIIKPASSIEKDPRIDVMPKSEDSYIFVKIEQSENFSDYLFYELSEGWIKLEGEDNVYYREYYSSSEIESYEILRGNSVGVLENIKQKDLENLYDNYPTLSFIAYAVQKRNEHGIFNVNEAWDIVKEW